MLAHYQQAKKDIVRRLISEATPAELILKRSLSAFHVKHIFQWPVTIKRMKWRKLHFYVADFYLPYHATIIEIDGTYHVNRMFKDQFRTKEMVKSTRMVRTVLRFFNYEIHHDIKSVINTIMQLKPVRKTPLTRPDKIANGINNKSIMKQNELRYIVNIDNELQWSKKQAMLKAITSEPEKSTKRIAIRKKGQTSWTVTTQPL